MVPHPSPKPEGDRDVVRRYCRGLDWTGGSSRRRSFQRSSLKRKRPDPAGVGPSYSNAALETANALPRMTWIAQTTCLAQTTPVQRVAESTRGPGVGRHDHGRARFLGAAKQVSRWVWQHVDVGVKIPTPLRRPDEVTP